MSIPNTDTNSSSESDCSRFTGSTPAGSCDTSPVMPFICSYGTTVTELGSRVVGVGAGGVVLTSSSFGVGSLDGSGGCVTGSGEAGSSFGWDGGG